MIKKIILVVSVLSLASSAQAYNYYWGSTSGDWSNPAIWSDSVKPSTTVAGNALILGTPTIDVTTSGQGAWDCIVGYDNGSATLNIAAGIEWTVKNSLTVGDGDNTSGVLNVHGTAHSSGLRMGCRATASGTINVLDGGLLKLGDGGWVVNVGEAVGASGHINLKGNGSMIIDGDGGQHLNLFSGRGHIDIESGYLKVLGDHRNQLQGYIDNGWITSYGGTGGVNFPVLAEGYTVVTAVACDRTSDLNYDCYIDFADLAIFLESWLKCTDPLDPQCESDNFALFSQEYPFSFNYDGVRSQYLLLRWTKQLQTTVIDANTTKLVTTWVDPVSGMKVIFEKITYSAFSAVDWLLYFENTGNANTGIISNIQVLDTSISDPGYNPSYMLHRTNGGIPDVNQCEVSTLPITKTTPRTLSTVNGTPSTKDLPFFRIDTGSSAIIMGIGWTGNWKVTMECPDDITLKLKASMGPTNFFLYPGEKVRTPRILALVWNGEKIESNSQFRQLIYKYYSPELNGEKLLPVATCNTGYTHMELGGFWDVETTAANQISMINAYGQLGIKYMVTDAGWMQDCLRNGEDLWTNGMGSWVARTDHYPNGVKPVADAAEAVGIKWGLWMTPEMANPGTIVYTQHPEWLAGGYCMVDFGKPAVIKYMYDIVDNFMKLSPGFRVYRTDGGFVPPIEPEGASRTGIMEMKYVMGLYEFWDRISTNYPDSFRYGCDCGGQRIDLEMIKRFHVNQKSDVFSVNDVDQASIWALSQYLPNNLIDVPLIRMDDYTVHSTFASSINLGWVADAPGFDFNKANAILAKYNALAPRLIGAWYPLLPYSRDTTVWMASQYHRPDLEQGIVLAFRHANSAEPTRIFKLYGLTSTATYQIYFNSTGQTITRTGAQLMEEGLSITISATTKSELIEYQKL